MIFYVYMLASRFNGTLYIGMTRDLVKRVWEHKIKAVPGFAAKYGVDRLVGMSSMLRLSPRLPASGKEWKRAWKIQLIEADNPQWIDLYPSILQ